MHTGTYLKLVFQNDTDEDLIYYDLQWTPNRAAASYFTVNATNKNSLHAPALGWDAWAFPYPDSPWTSVWFWSYATEESYGELPVTGELVGGTSVGSTGQLKAHTITYAVDGERKLGNTWIEGGGVGLPSVAIVPKDSPSAEGDVMLFEYIVIG